MQTLERRPVVLCTDEGRPVAADAPPLAVLELGQVDYARAVAIQEDLAGQRQRGERPDTLLLLEHPPTITLGRRTPESDVLTPPETLARLGVAVHRTTRGGLATYHGPGQVVGYPIVHLRERQLTVPDYICCLQRAVIQALGAIGVEAFSDPDHVGVWTARGKIGAIGVAQHHGVTMHGFAVNLQPDLAHFNLINPCGIGELGVTSAAAILGHPVDPAPFKAAVATALAAQLGLPGVAPTDAVGV